MYQKRIFETQQKLEMSQLIVRFPLALLHASDGQQFLSTPLPLVLETLADGTELLHGHLSRHNPQLALLQKCKQANITFMGEQAYISSAWLRDRRYAPTWNYEFLQFDVSLEFDESQLGIYQALRRLIQQMDANEAQPWQIEESPRLSMLAEHIVAFKARIITSRAVLKLGQGDPAELIQDALAGLRNKANFSMAARMEQYLAGVAAE